MEEFSELLVKLTQQVDQRSDQLSVLEALLVQNSANLKFMPTLAPIINGWFSSNFGYRIDPFTGLQSFHEGIDFPANRGARRRGRRQRQGHRGGMAPAVW